MVSVVDVIGLLVIIGVNATVAAVMTRFFRVRLDSAWGPVVFALAFEPVVLLLLAQFFGAIGLGFNLGNAGIVIVVTILLPMAVGLAFDYFWMPAPDEVDLPAEYGESGPDTQRR